MSSLACIKPLAKNDKLLLFNSNFKVRPIKIDPIISEVIFKMLYKKILVREKRSGSCGNRDVQVKHLKRGLLWPSIHEFSVNFVRRHLYL